MKSALSALFAASLLVFAGGCSHLDLQSNGDSDHVLTGTVDLANPATLPPDAVLVVRVIDLKPPPPPTPLATSAAPKMELPPQIVGEATFQDLGSPPFPFRVEYNADDDALRRGLAIEARISFGGRLQYTNLTQYMVGADDAGDPQHLVVGRR
jgi:uncharacterized lipoprotein YbaY